MSRSSKKCLAPTRKAKLLEEARANLEEAFAMVLDANRELSEQSL
jgi:predicted RNase H-like HicB family nuclease